MRLSPVVTLARQDLRLTLRDRSSIFWIFLSPILWVYLFGSISTAPDPSRTTIGLRVIQRDGSDTAGRFIDQLRAENFDVSVIMPADPEPATEATRTLEVPEDFSDALAAHRKTVLKLTEGRNASTEGTFATQLALHKASVRLLAEEAFGPGSVEGDRVTLESSWAGVRTVPSGYYQTIPGYLIMFILLSSMTYGASLLAQEKRAGLLRRLGASSLTSTEIITGKLAGRVLIGIVQTLVFLLMGTLIFKIGWGDAPVALAIFVLIFIVCAATIGMLSGTLFRSPDAAAGIGVVFTLVLSALGGCWWPAEIMPGWLQSASYVLPSAWAMNGLHELISWGGDLGDVLPHCGILAAFALAAGFVAVRRLRTSLQ